MMMDLCFLDEIILQGVTESGTPFRPSDWWERLSGILCSFGQDHKISYSPYLRPLMLDGIWCVAVHRRLETIDPRAFAFLLGFARDNQLRVMDCRTLMAKVDSGEIAVGEVCPVPDKPVRSQATPTLGAA
jgi:hypothetical protein